MSVGFVACDANNELDAIPEDVVPNVALTAGSADFSKYVSVGASFTAGFTDGAMFIAAQENSFPNILAKKFASVGGGDFTQPLMADNTGGFVAGGQIITNPLTGENVFPPRFYFNGAAPTRLGAASTTDLANPLSGAFNNVGVPGAKSFHLTFPGYGQLNPYFGRMASSGTATVLGDAVAQNPTFFTMVGVGGNDVLGYALSGGSGTNQAGNLNPATYGGNDISDPNVFAQVYSNMVTALTAGGAKGAVANLPYITSLANFTTVPYNAIPLDAATASALNAAFAPYNGGLQQILDLKNANLLPAQVLPLVANYDQAEVDSRQINFVAGQNPVLILDEYLSNLAPINGGLTKMRQATADDMLILASSGVLGTTVGGNPQLIRGVSVPLADNWVLTPQEQNNIKVATDAYNVTIEAIASANPNLVLVDFKALLEKAATTGVWFDNFNLTANLVTGGLVSLDGVHLTARGYALMANEILRAIDSEFGSNFEDATDGLAKAANYPTNYSPGL